MYNVILYPLVSFSKAILCDWCSECWCGRYRVFRSQRRKRQLPRIRLAWMSRSPKQRRISVIIEGGYLLRTHRPHHMYSLRAWKMNIDGVSDDEEDIIIYYMPELSTGHFSWTRPDPGETLTRPDPRLPSKSLTRPDPTRGPTLPPYVLSLIEYLFINYLIVIY